MSIQQKVRQFHEVYEQPIGNKPAPIDPQRLILRLQLIAEEFVELLEACGVRDGDIDSLRSDLNFFIADRADNFDMVEAADALGDIAYVVEGMNLELGIDSAKVLDEIQRSNLSKLGEDGKPICRADGKIQKGPNFKEPDIARVLREQGWSEQ
jgi:predicted HAD superfamily Cof-like phosphohydrolase